jgi:hypothetical protein
MIKGIKSKINYNAFCRFKNKYQNDTCVVCGTGGSFNLYSPINGAIHIGCNRGIYYEKLIFDFYFFHDWSQINNNFRNDIIAYKPTIQKFFGCFVHNRGYGCNINDAKRGDAILYDMECSYSKGRAGFQKYIDMYCIGNAGRSTIFACMQFALFSGFKNIYLVGCDLDNSQFKNVPKWRNGPHKLKKAWENFKDFSSIHFPDTNIGVINPIGLKGLFNTVSI